MSFFTLLLRIAFGAFIISFMTPANSSAVKFGMKAGLSVSDQTFHYSISNFSFDRLHKYGLAIGAFAEFQIYDGLGLRTQIDYVEKGSEFDVRIAGFDSPVPTENYTFGDRIDYLGINLLATLSLTNSNVFNPYIVAGPRLDVLLSTSSDLPSLVLDDMKSTTFGATAGLGTIIPLNNTVSILVEGIYSPDLTNAFESDLLSVKNSTFIITTGIVF